MKQLAPDLKICGLCRPQDAAAAELAGASYLGVVLSEGFRRTQSLEAARTIFSAPTGGARRVGVFVNEPAEVMLEAAHELSLSVLQLHGDEPEAILEELRAGSDVELWKAVRAVTADELLAAAARFHDLADALLVEGAPDGLVGGAGAPFDWERLEAARDRLPEGVRIVLAGGLTPATVRDAVRRMAPDVVDVSSGVEAAVGAKSVELMESFARAIRPVGLNPSPRASEAVKHEPAGRGSRGSKAEEG